MIVECIHNTYVFSTDKQKLNIAYIHNFLSVESYWAKHIPLQTVIKSIEGSLCFGIYDADKQIGFARVITDNATFAYLADVFVDTNYRGKGLSKQLMTFIFEQDFTKIIRRFLLATLDAHSLYEQFGFTALQEPKRIMGIKYFDHY